MAGYNRVSEADITREIVAGMRRAGATQKEAAKYAGVSRRQVQIWERGKNIPAARPKQYAGTWPKHIHDEARRLFKEGNLNKLEISEVLGVPYGTVKSWLPQVQERRPRKDYVGEHLFHPTYNRNFDLAPVYQLWYRTEDVMRIILDFHDLDDVTRQLAPSGAASRSWRRWRADDTLWARLDVVDMIFCKLGLHISYLPDPFWCSNVPNGERHIEATSCAA